MNLEDFESIFQQIIFTLENESLNYADKEKESIRPPTSAPSTVVPGNNFIIT